MTNKGQIEGQMSLFDLDTWFSKTCAEPSVPTTEKISDAYSKKPQRWLTKTPAFLDLRRGKSGLQQDVSWVTDIALLIGCMTPNIGECRSAESAYVYSLTSTDIQPQRYYLNLSEKPSIPRPSKLSETLETNPDPKYNLSPKACLGILRRAEKRGKKLPELLQRALEQQAKMGR